MLAPPDTDSTFWQGRAFDTGVLEKERPQQPAWKTVIPMAPSGDDFCLAIPDLEASTANQCQEGQHVGVHLILSCSRGRCWQLPHVLWTQPSAADAG